MKLKEFLEKWEWKDLDEADSVMQWAEKTFIKHEKEIIELKRKNQALEESEIRADERRKVCKLVRDCIFTYGRYDEGRIELDGMDIFNELDKIEGGTK